MTKKRPSKGNNSRRQSKASKGGRPKGSRQKRRTLATAAPSRCPNCGSTNRTRYIGQPIASEHTAFLCGQCQPLHGDEGKDCDCGGTFAIPFTQIVRRRTSCKDCDQHRFDVSYEFKPTKKKHAA